MTPGCRAGHIADVRSSLQQLLVLTAVVLSVGLAPFDRVQAQNDYRPHFVSLRHSTVNVRTGPGTRYPIEWVYRRAGLPVEAIAEYEEWIRVRDYEGAEGWVHRRLLSSDRWAVITGSLRTVRREPHDDSNPVLFAEPGVQGHLLACRDSWCEVEIGTRRGWVRREVLWGVYPGENFD